MSKGVQSSVTSVRRAATVSAPAGRQPWRQRRPGPTAPRWRHMPTDLRAAPQGIVSRKRRSGSRRSRFECCPGEGSTGYPIVFCHVTRASITPAAPTTLTLPTHDPVTRAAASLARRPLLYPVATLTPRVFVRPRINISQHSRRLAGEGCGGRSGRRRDRFAPRNGRPSVRPPRSSPRSWPRANPDSRGCCAAPRRWRRPRPYRSAPRRSGCSSSAASRAGPGGR